MPLIEPMIVHVHAAATWFMLGVIWLVQLGQYPLLAYVDEDSFSKYHSRYAKSMSGVVILPMMVELVTGAALLKIYEGSDKAMLSSISIGLIFVIWASTILIQVPLHQKLAHGFDEAVHKRLVVTNWLRTSLWSFRGILVAALMLE